MNVDVPFVEPRGFDTDLRRDGPNIGTGGVDGFLHHIAQFPGRFHPPLTWQSQCFDLQQITAHAGPGKPGDNADLVFFFDQTVAEFLDPKVIVKVFARHRHLLGLTLDDLRHGLAGQFRDLAFKVTHPGFAGVATDHFVQRFVGDFEFTFAQAVVLDLFVNQVLTRDFAFFVLGVPGKRNDLHPVQKRARHIVGVRRRQEHHVGQVIFDLKVMIDERTVLFRVQHLKHGRGRITTEILAHFVDFIEQNQRIGGFRLFQRLNDLTGHRPDISAPVTTDFAFVAHAAQ